MEFVFDKNFSDNTDEDIFESPFQQALSSSTSSNNSVARSPRRSVATSFDEVEFNPPPKRKKARKSKPKPKYIGTTAKTKKWYHVFGKITAYKLAWVMAGFFVLRLVFMESGILDYHRMNQTIADKEKSLVELRQENAELIKEIKKIRTSSAYQKKMAREHLGVIAPNEYLVVFSRK